MITAFAFLLLHNFRDTNFEQSTNFLGIRELVRCDSLLLLFAKNKFERLGEKEERRLADINNIRNKLRSLARLVKNLHEICPKMKTSKITDFIVPQHYDNVVNAARQLALESPQLGLAIGHYVKQVTLHKVALAIKSENLVDLKHAENFDRLYNASWSESVASLSSRRQKLRQLNKPVELPLTEDVKTVGEFLESSIGNSLENSSSCRKRLAKLVLADLILFNKRRPAEVAQLKVSDAKIRHSEDDNEEIVGALSQPEKCLAKRLV